MDVSSRQQLFEGEGLGHVVVGPALEPGHTVGNRTARRQHDDGHAHALASNLLEDLEAVDVGQAHVQEHEGAPALQGGFDGIGSRGVDLRDEAGGAQSFGDEGSDPGLVLNDENGRHDVSPDAPQGRRGITRVKVEPTPGVDSMSRCPPWARAIDSTMFRPRPDPATLSVPAVPRTKR